MFAVFKTGGKQYNAQVGDCIKVEKLEAQIDDSVSFDEVLIIKDKKINLGSPYIANASVTAKVIEQGRAKKIQIIKFKRRKHHMKSMGHRQYYTKVEITGIST